MADIPSGVLSKNGGLTGGTTATTYSISDLHRFIKQFDKDFHLKILSPAVLHRVGTIRCAYQLQNTEKWQSSAKGSGASSLAPSASTATIKNISDLFSVVNSKDKNFHPKPVSKALLHEDGTFVSFEIPSKKRTRLSMQTMFLERADYKKGSLPNPR